MRRWPATTALLALAIALCVGAVSGAVALRAGAASAEIVQKGDLRVTFDGDFTPRALPRNQLAPVTINVEGRIATTDGARPPALRKFEVGLNRNGRLSTVGLPVCRAQQLQSVSTEVALARCGSALVGRGNFAAYLENASGPVPSNGRILAFNSVFRRRPAVLLHFYTAAPARVALVLPLAIYHRSRGQLGTVLQTAIPVLAGGIGSITKIKLRIGRNYGYRGRRRSFLSASCAAPAGFSVAIFPFARGSFDFVDGRTIKTTLTRNCRVRR